MELYDLDAILAGLAGVTAPKALTLMAFGVIASSFFAAMPGIGSLLFLSMTIPYAMTLDPFSCIALLLGIGVVSNTANTFSSVLIAVPGSAGSQATIVDGHPMARKGEARRAFGAAFTASALGGLFGGVVFVLSLPIMKPMVLAFGSPDFLMLVLWGLSAVAILSGNAPIKGLMAAFLGLGISLIGTDARTGIERFTFEDYYLWDGVHIVLVALGVFAIPELVDLSIRRTSVSDSGKLGSGLWQGVKDVFIHWWLMIRCSIVGVWVGMLPGLGSSVADWFAYAHAVQTEKNTENFGKGDVRGVIAPESSNNAKEGGALIPTTIFGVPGSTSYALMLVAFIAVGIKPGETMLTTQLPYLYGMIWVLVIANLFATGLAIGFSNIFAKASVMPFQIIVPMALVLCTVAAFSASFSHADLLMLLIFSIIGLVMKRLGWPRPPLLVAVVLGPQLQNYLWLSIDRYGFEWLGRPAVLVLLALIIVTVFYPLYKQWRSKKESMHMDITSDGRVSHGRNIVAVCGYIGLAVGAAMMALDWPMKAALGVYFVSGFVVFLGLTQIALDCRTLKKERASSEVLEPVRWIGEREKEIAYWIAGLGASVLILGFHITFFVFPLLYSRRYGSSWRTALFLGALAECLLIGLFDTLIHIVWPETYLNILTGIEFIK